MFKKILFAACIARFCMAAASGQITFDLQASDRELRIDQVVELCAPPNALATSQPMTCVVSNCSYQDGRGTGVLLSELDQRLTTVRSHRLFGQRTVLQARDAVSAGPDYYVLGSLQSDGNFISRISTGSADVLWTKAIAISKPGFRVEASDLLWQDGSLLILSNMKSDSGIISGFVLSKMTERGELLWSKSFEGSASSSYRYSASSMAVYTDGSILVTGIRTNKTSDTDRSVFLMKLSESGQSEIQKILTFSNAFSKRLNPGKPFLDVNGVNIHLAMQALDQGIHPDILTITMIDDELAVRTWRNYSPRFSMEEFRIGSNKFLMSGQILGDSSDRGYALVGINNANAIPEILDFNRSGILNQNAKGSSSVAYHRSWQRYVMAGLKQDDAGSGIFIEVRPERKESNCVDTFSFTVTKDPIQSEETLDLTEGMAILETSDLNLFLEPVQQQLEPRCNLTAVEDQDGDDFVYPTVAGKTLWIRSADPSGHQYFVAGMDGSLDEITADRDRIDIGHLSPGVHVLIRRNKSTGQRSLHKFVKQD